MWWRLAHHSAVMPMTTPPSKVPSTMSPPSSTAALRLAWPSTASVQQATSERGGTLNSSANPSAAGAAHSSSNQAFICRSSQNAQRKTDAHGDADHKQHPHHDPYHAIKVIGVEQIGRAVDERHAGNQEEHRRRHGSFLRTGVN